MTMTYEDWQSSIARSFLSAHEGPTIFFIDDSELARLCPSVPDAAGDLAEAVRSRLGVSYGKSMFSPVVGSYRQWKGGCRTDAPPVLPVIAITVLAATRMRADAHGRATNYYLRLAQAIEPEASESCVERLRNELREGGAFLDVVEMWQGLHAWIEDQAGAVGVSTIREHPRLQRIGYPLSQALMRQSDRSALTGFFDAIKLVPADAPEGEELLRELDIWTSSPRNRLSEVFRGALQDGDLRALLATVVEAHAKAWDGRVRTREGKQRISMRLGVDLEQWRVRWYFAVAEGCPDSITLNEFEGSQEIHLSIAEGVDYYSVRDSPPVRPEMIRSGARFHGGEVTAEFPPSDVLFLRPDVQTGGWTSATGMVLFEEHLVVIGEEYSREFEKLLCRAADLGWRCIPQRGSVLLPGFAIFEGVRFADRSAFADAVSQLPGLHRIDVATAPIPRARLVHGLPVATSISSTCYLVGGEPDLLLPSDAQPRTVAVTFDGRQQEFLSNGSPIPLRLFIAEAGSHAVDVDGQSLTFTTVEEGPNSTLPGRTAMLGWDTDGRIVEDQGGGVFAVIGAQARSTADVGLVLARRRRSESWLLYEGGRAEKLTEPAAPSFLSTLDIYSQCFEVRAPARARWLAQRGRNGWNLTELGTANPEEYELDLNVIDAWRRACHDENGAQLWKLQLSMARGPA